MSRRRRTLAPEEEAQWQAVARTAQPLPGRRAGAQVSPVHPQIEGLPPALQPQPPPPLAPFRLGERALPPLPAKAAPSPLRMDAGAFRAMTRGRLAPEARIDLHGMTLAEAQPELVRFVLNAQSAGLRLVLVITGKGSRRAEDDGPIPRRPGVLRHQVPLWLRQVPLAAAVQQVAEAHVRHGGAGALYVYLRRISR